jgi:hypothetical protein
MPIAASERQEMLAVRPSGVMYFDPGVDERRLAAATGSG